MDSLGIPEHNPNWKTTVEAQSYSNREMFSED